MKKCILLFVVLVLALSLQLGAAEGALKCKPGERFEAEFIVRKNPNHAVIAILDLEYDHSVFQPDSMNGFSDDAQFITDLNGIAEGKKISVFFQVRSDAPDGEYTLRAVVREAGDIQENLVTGLEIEPVTVKVYSSKETPPVEYYSNGKIKTVNELDANGRLVKSTRYNRYGVVRYYTVYEAWDQNGNATNYTQYYPWRTDKYKEYHCQSKYDEAGHEIQYTYTYADGSKGYSYNYSYDASGRESHTVAYDADGILQYYNINYVYDQDNHLISYTRLNPDKSVQSYYHADWKDGIRIGYEYRDQNQQLIGKYEDDPVYGDTLYSMSVSNGSKTENIYTYADNGYKLEYVTSGKRNSKSIFEYDIYERYQRIDEYNESGRKTSYSVYQYDSSGNATSKYYSLSEDGSYRVRDYNEKNQLTKFSEYSAQGELTGYEITEYNQQGKRIKETEYTADGKIESYTLYEYDSQGRDKQKIEYYPSGAKHWVTQYRYLEDGTRQYKWDSYYEDGSILRKGEWRRDIQ